MTQGKRESKLSVLEQMLLTLMTLTLCLDSPSARAYNEHESWTELLGQFLFHGFKDLYSIPLPVTLFELLSFALFMAVLILWGFQKAQLWKTMLASAVLVPIAVGIAWVSGGLRGNDISLGLTQLHAVPMLPVWLTLGFYLGIRPSNCERIFQILFFSSLFKAFYALYVFIVIYQGSMGEREFLIDHPSSIYLLCGMLYGVWQILRRDLSLVKKFLFLVALFAIGSVYVLNDRRASFAGVALALLALPFILPTRFRADLWPLYRAAIGLGGIVLFGLALDSSNPYSFTGGLKSEFMSQEVLSYRHIENFNLLSGVMEDPIFGMGFGTHYPQVIELPDISATFSLFTAIPHNTLYFLWTFAGPLGMAAFTSLAWVTIILITRCGAWARTSAQLFYAILALFLAAQWIVFVYFDMGLLEVRSLMVFGIVIGSLYPQYARHLKELYHEKLA
jgi:hypothetical protein